MVCTWLHVHIKALNVSLPNVKMELIVAPINFSNERPHLVKWTASDESLEYTDTMDVHQVNRKWYLIVNLRGLHITHPLTLKRKCVNVIAESEPLKLLVALLRKWRTGNEKKASCHVKRHRRLVAFQLGKMLLREVVDAPVVAVGFLVLSRKEYTQ